MRGQSLIELLIAMGLLTLLLPALLVGMVSSSSGRASETQQLQSTALLNEGVEAVRSVREESWNNVSTNGTFHPVLTGGVWQLLPGASPVGQFSRQVVIGDTQRNSNGDIVSSGGNVDNSTKTATVTVSWNTPLLSSVSSTVYLTRYINNQAISQPSPMPFSSGPPALTNVVVASNPQQVQLGLAGPGRPNSDWCSPTVVAQNNLPTNASADSVWAVPGEAFVGMARNGSRIDFVNLSISNATAPSNPTATQNGTLSNDYRTSDIYGESGFAYISTASNTNPVAILSVNNSNGSVSQTGSVNLGTATNASSIFAANNVGSYGSVGFVTAGSKLYSFDLNSKSGTKNPLSSFNLTGTANSIYVLTIQSKTYVFAAINNTSNQLQVVDVTNPLSMSNVLTYSVGVSQAANAVDVSPDGLRVYLAMNVGNNSQPGLFVIDSTNLTSGTPSMSNISSYVTSGMNPQTVKIVLSKNRVLLGGTGGAQQYQVVNLRNESSPVSCGGTTFTGGVLDIATVVESDGDAYAYLVTGDSSNEFKVIDGGPRNEYATSGTYESGNFDVLSNDSFNRFQASLSSINPSVGENVKFQVALMPPVSNSCAGVSFQNANFVGPDGTSSSYFFDGSQSGSINLVGTFPFLNNSNYQNPNRCFRYRAYLYPSSNFLSTPVLNAMQINYTP